MLVNEKVVNQGVGLVPWAEIPLDVKESLLDHLRVWCDNMEAYFDYDNMHLGLWVPMDEGITWDMRSDDQQFQPSHYERYSQMEVWPAPDAARLLSP